MISVSSPMWERGNGKGWGGAGRGASAERGSEERAVSVVYVGAERASTPLLQEEEVEEEERRRRIY